MKKKTTEDDDAVDSKTPQQSFDLAREHLANLIGRLLAQRWLRQHMPPTTNSYDESEATEKTI